MLRTFVRPALLLACLLASGGAFAQSRWPPRWIKIVAADFTGALEGASTGAKLGAVLGPEGATVGAVVGAVITGAQASTEAAAQTTTAQGVPAGSLAKVNPANALNPFDHVGQHHNASLDPVVGIIGPGGCIPNPFPFPFPRDRTQGPIWDYASKSMNAPREFLAQPELKSAWNESLDFVTTAINSDEDIAITIQNRVKSGRMSAAVGERVIRYFNTITPLDTDAMIEATKSFEQETLADKTLKEEERIGLLSAYSVARYSAAYWAEQAAWKTASPWCGCGQ